MPRKKKPSKIDVTHNRGTSGYTFEFKGGKSGLRKTSTKLKAFKEVAPEILKKGIQQTKRLKINKGKVEPRGAYIVIEDKDGKLIAEPIDDKQITPETVNETIHELIQKAESEYNPDLGPEQGDSDENMNPNKVKSVTVRYIW